MSTSEEDVANFASITGVDIEQARFFLESSEGDLELAVASFFDSGAGGAPGAGATPNPAEFDDMDEDEDEEDYLMLPGSLPTPAPAVPTGRTLSGAPVPAPSPLAAPRASAPSGGYTLGGGVQAASGSWGGGSATSSSSSSRATTPQGGFRATGVRPRVATLGDLNAGSAPAPRAGSSRLGRVGQPGPADDNDDEGEEREQAEFFTGGEKSGLAVANPNAGKGRGANDVIKGILQKAQEGGNRLAALAGGAMPQLPSVFSGSAHTLGSDDTPSTLIPDPSARPKQEEAEEEEVEETAVRNLTFWEDGFSIEDGELMRYDDPANKEILTAINSGRAPLSLLKVRHNQPVELHIAKRLSEKWTRQPPPPAGPFTGSGHRLGSESPLHQAPPPPPVVTEKGAERADSGTVFEVDQGAPVTSLQIRLRDGTRMVARFNHSHTVGDVRAYINASHPGQASINYALQTTFPSRDLTDDSQTLADANLLGSVVVQRGL